MQEPGSFRCPECGLRVVGAALSGHLVDHPEERTRVFARFVAEHKHAETGEGECTGHKEIVPLMDAEERTRFGVGEVCAAPVMACACMGSFCAHHTFSCSACGRFACLRHRWSATCPDCARSAAVRPVRVERYDPFSRERSTVIRTYRRGEEPEAWEAVADPARGE